MSAMANTTLIVTTVTKTATKEKVLKEMDAAPRVNIQDFCEEHYEDILPVIMDKIRRDKQKEVHTRLHFGDNTKRSRRTRESSQNSSAGTWSARHQNPSKKPRVKDRSRDGDGNVFGRLGRALEITLRSEVVLTDGTLPRAKAVPEVKIAPVALKNHMIIPTPPIGQRTARVWFDELPPESIDGYKDLKAAFLAYFMQQKKYVKDPVEIHNIKQRDGETLEDFMERFC
ncbi:reverse transcriptase domain-containing protein [Tanacetum coccineum]|uniref:Reverse transcriptase domain-containing protein n=1 Tax=Tanacetum coccineum TaxID=301880 RepID=A0ABQ4X2L4_9ASTR